MNLHPGETPSDHEPIPHEEEPMSDEEWFPFADAIGVPRSVAAPRRMADGAWDYERDAPDDLAPDLTTMADAFAAVSDRLEMDNFLCQVCSHPIDEEGHDYHEPRCATMRAAMRATDPDAFDLSTGCQCDGYVHEGCCSECAVAAVLAPVLAVLEHREEF